MFSLAIDSILNCLSHTFFRLHQNPRVLKLSIVSKWWRCTSVILALSVPSIT